MFDGVTGTRAGLVAAVAALACCAAFASAASANYYQLQGPPIVTRTSLSAFDHGYRGGQFSVTPWGTSSDGYYCPAPEGLSGWVVVGDDADSHDRAFVARNNGDEYDGYFVITVTNWSLSATVNLRAVVSCTNTPGLYGFNDPTDNGPSDYQDFWDSQFKAGAPANPPVSAYADLIPRAFCWSFRYPGCPITAGSRVASTRGRVASVRARRGGNRFALHNGTNKLGLRFNHSAGGRPPAVLLSGARGCRARRMPLSVMNATGRLLLELRCRGLKRGATARVTIKKPIVRHFRLGRGSGRLRVHLDKPPGTVEPYAHVSYGKKGTPCKSVGHKLRLRSRTFNLRVSARCGTVARNAVGHLHVGGLLTAGR